MVELGLAISWDEPTFLFRDDYRRCTDCDAYPLNLMLLAGLPASGWEAYSVHLARGDCRPRQSALTLAEILTRLKSSAHEPTRARCHYDR